MAMMERRSVCHPASLKVASIPLAMLFLHHEP
jgi:hypothetical protein